MFVHPSRIHKNTDKLIDRYRIKDQMKLCLYLEAFNFRGQCINFFCIMDQHRSFFDDGRCFLNGFPSSLPLPDN